MSRDTLLVLRRAMYITCLGLFSMALVAACDSKDLEITERTYDPANGTFVVAGNVKREFNYHAFTFGEETTFDQLSFGIWDGGYFRQYSGIKKIHILNDKALGTYRKKYLIPGKGCPASFMNQNLQSVVLLPVDEYMAYQLEDYDIPFDGRGTPFSLTGHFLQHDHSYFVEDGRKRGLEIIKHENVMSNVGSAKHKVHYFLVTSINAE